MLKKLSRKLAGCIVIELVGAAAAFAVDYPYKAGFAAHGHVEALVLEDRKGHRAVITNATFSVPLSVADSIAAEAIKQYALERPSILIYSVASGDPVPAEAQTAIGAALGD